jgi:hypothetical protein
MGGAAVILRALRRRVSNGLVVAGLYVAAIALLAVLSVLSALLFVVAVVWYGPRAAWRGIA